MKYLALFFLIAFAGCGGSSSSDPSSKPLFSTWTEDGNGFILAMGGGGFGSNNFEYILTGGAICNCIINVTGSDSSGNAVMSSCSYGSGGSGDPGCASLDASYTYSKTSTVLSICTGGTCNTYH